MNRHWETLFTAAKSRIGIPIALKPRFSNKTRRRPAWKALAAFCLLSTLQLFGQEYGSVSGTVLDASGAAIAGATVTITQLETGRQTTVTTNGSGNYAFPSLAPAHYKVKIMARGFEAFQESDVILQANQLLTLGAKLKVGTATETVEVNTGAPGSYAAPDSGSATRTNTPLIEVPQSVEVLNRALIQDQDRRTLGDALVNVSGVVPTKSEEILFLSPIVRGFPAEIYSDGLAMFGNTTTANDPTSLVGVERIEVVKGPNSTMYGGGLGSPLGGLIDVVSVRPETRMNGYMALRGGNFGTFDPYGDLNIPLNTKIAARLAGEYQRNDSWVDVVSGDRWSLQPAMSFQLGPKH
jgi:outer membrane receptor for ferric coprogen and ferric-rhodotorulic acid